MTTTTITRYKCDWCGSGADVAHHAEVRAALPAYWEHADVEGMHEDLCKFCAETLRAVLESEDEAALVLTPDAPATARPAQGRHAGVRPSWVTRRLTSIAAQIRTAGAGRNLPGSLLPLGARRSFGGRYALTAICAVVALLALAGAAMTGRMPVISATSQPAPRTDVSAGALTAAPSVASAVEGASVEGAAAPAPTPVAVPAGSRITAVGDSVMLGAAEGLQRAFSTIEVDAAVGRQAPAVIESLRQRQAAGTLGSVVVVHMGDNGLLTSSQVDEMMQVLAGVPAVLLMNVHVPRSWEAPNNALLAEAAQRYANAELVDWAAASATHPELFADDQLHLNSAGAAFYVDLVAQLLRPLGIEPATEALPTATSAAVPPASPAAATVAAPAAATLPAGYNAYRAALAVVARRDVQIRISVDGATVFDGVLRANESQSWEGSSRVEVWTNDARNLQVTVNGFALGSLAEAVGHPTWNTVDWNWSAGWKP